MFEDFTPKLASGVSLDSLEQHLVESMALVSQVTASMLPMIRALDVAQVMCLDGARGMDEWLAARLDIEVKTARTLLGLARASDPRIETSLENGAPLTGPQ